MDRRAMFTPVFAEFLDSQKRVVREERTQSRYPAPEGKGYQYTSTEWRQIMEPSYIEQIVPQTLSDADVQNDRWPAAIYCFQLADGKQIETFVQRSREFHSMNLTVDFMGLRRVMRNGTREIIEEFCWSDAEMNDYLPQIASGGSTTGTGRRTPKALEVEEPQPV